MATSRTAPSPHAHHIRVERTARYYTLGGDTEPVQTIWFLLHGYGQLAGDFIRYFADLAAPETLLVAPEAMNRFYLVGVDKAPARERPVGATWMTREDRDSEIADYVEFLDALHEEVVARAGAANVRVNLIGFSQGAATATRWVMNGRARLDRLVLWGGLIPPDANLSTGPAGLRQVPLTIVVGRRDHYVTPEMVTAERARLDAAGIPYDLIEFDGGHVVSRSVFPRLAASDASAR